MFAKGRGQDEGMDNQDAVGRLGRAVQMYREWKGWTQDEVAQNGGPSDVTVRGLENGAGKRPNAATLRKLDRGLGWPEGFAAKILAGDATAAKPHTDGTGRVELYDFTKQPAGSGPPPKTADGTPIVPAHNVEKAPATSGTSKNINDTPIKDLTATQILFTLTSRLMDQDLLIGDLRSQLESARGEVRRLHSEVYGDEDTEPEQVKVAPRRGAHLSAVPGTLSQSEREELYRRADEVDLDAEPYAAARPEDTSDDDESV